MLAPEEGEGGVVDGGEHGFLGVSRGDAAAGAQEALEAVRERQGGGLAGTVRAPRSVRPGEKGGDGDLRFLELGGGTGPTERHPDARPGLLGEGSLVAGSLRSASSMLRTKSCRARRAG